VRGAAGGEGGRSGVAGGFELNRSTGGEAAGTKLEWS